MCHSLVALSTSSLWTAIGVGFNWVINWDTNAVCGSAYRRCRLIQLSGKLGRSSTHIKEYESLKKIRKCLILIEDFFNTTWRRRRCRSRFFFRSTLISLFSNNFSLSLSFCCCHISAVNGISFKSGICIVTERQVMYNNREKGETNMNEMYFKIPVMRRDLSLIFKRIHAFLYRNRIGQTIKSKYTVITARKYK